MTKASLLLISLLPIIVCACGRNESKDRRRMPVVAIGSVPGQPGGKAQAAVDQTFKDNNIFYFYEGSVSYTIYVKTADAQRARLLLRSNTNVIVISDTGNFLQLRARH